jgi:hypothetical protein
MRKCANISPYMRRPLDIFDFATAPFLNFLIYEENLIFFFISAGGPLSLRIKLGQPSKFHETK